MFWLLTPVFGILLFVCLYLIAAHLYPGGSQVDVNAKGFSWINNYWCNLLSENAISGQHNPARHFAIAGMVILCFSLSIFWYVFPLHMEFKKPGRFLIRFSGIASMVIPVFLFTGLHDVTINVAALFGIIALLATFTGLYKNGWYLLLYFGIFNLLLVGVNNYIYYTNGLIIYLPVIQKITFVSFLVWVCCNIIKAYRRVK